MQLLIACVQFKYFLNLCIVYIAFCKNVYYYYWKIILLLGVKLKQPFYYNTAILNL